jgi:hypothetical protein
MALVVEADDPLDNLAHARSALSLVAGPMSHGTVRILIEAEPPIYVARGFELDRDHWPVAGMQLPVTTDPADPTSFDVNWDEVPSISERAAANDPTLADPMGTHTRTMTALLAAGVAGSGVDPPPGDSGAALVAARALEVETGSDLRSGGFQTSMEAAAREPAPSGRMRAVVLIAASEATLVTPRGTERGWIKERHGTHAAVLAVNIPGRPPYAVFKKKFKHPGGKGLAAGAGLPALVSCTDPSDVEVLWSEMLSVRDRDRQTRDEVMAQANDRMAQFTARVTDMSSGSPPAPPPLADPAAIQVPAQVRETMIRNAQLALRSAPPAMRPMLIQQYGLAGITIDEDGNVTE